MKAIISTTFDDNYYFFLPITVWCWNKLGVDVVVFFPILRGVEHAERFYLSQGTMKRNNSKFEMHQFECPKHKEATYAQCSRLYAGALDLPDDEILVTSDGDMLTFKLPPFSNEKFTVFGSDLVPGKQVPMCYLSATRKEWRKLFSKGNSYQKCLDELLGEIECESFKGNYWGKDQETAYAGLTGLGYTEADFIQRATPGTQFASNRLDRDDAYILDRLNPDIFDYHMNRPGYEENNFNKILTVLKYFYSNEDFQWLTDYRNKYLALL